jgi:hypothetical protein
MLRVRLYEIGICATFLLPPVSNVIADEFPQTVRTTNFLVDAPTTELAQQVGRRAEELRREIAVAWLGSELPQSEHVNLILVEIDDQRSSGRTVVSPTNRGHFLTLTGTVEEVSHSMLAHEIVHTVFAARYGLDMPAWANEGVASRYDNAQRHEIRAQWLRDFVHMRLWPDLTRLMAEPIRSQSSYSAAAAVTEYLLQRRTPRQFLTFVEDGSRRGWDTALASHYGIADQAQLAQQWQQWVTEQVTGGDRHRLASARSRTTFVARRLSAATSFGL